MHNTGNKQSRENARNESGMTSNQDHQRPRATAMRAGPKHRDSEFMIAQSEYGGAAPDYSKAKEPSSKVPNQGPLNNPHHPANRVHVGLNKPSTVFSSIGGRNSGSTTAGFGRQSHGSSNAPPKEFVYREEDFQPLGHGSHSTRSPDSGKGLSVHSALSHGVHSIRRSPISSALGLRSDNHIQNSLGLNPAHFLSRQQAHSHVPSSSPSTDEGHARAVPAHRDEKIKHHVFHVVNEPADHHNHYRHQCDTEKCIDHNDSHQHLTPSGFSHGLYDYGHELASHHQPAVPHAHGHSESPVMDLASLFKEPASLGSKSHQVHKSSQGHHPRTAVHSVHAHGSENSIVNLAPMFREPVSWGPTKRNRSFAQESEIHHHQPHGHHQISGHVHSVPDHNDGKIKHHIYHVANAPTDHHNHFRHQCDSEFCMDHNASHEHAPHASNNSSYRHNAPHKHTYQVHPVTNNTYKRTKSPDLNLRSLFKEPVTWGPKRKSVTNTEEPITRRRHSQSHRQIPGHAHAVPAHRDGKIKHHLNHAPNYPTDFHNHYRHQCDSNQCMDHNDSHAHHSQPPVQSLKGHHVHVPIRHLHGIAKSHRAYAPLTSTGLNISAPVVSASSGSRSKLYYQHRRHSTGQELLPASHPIVLTRKQDHNWVLVTRKRRASEGSQHQDHPHHHVHRHAPRTPEMHLDALFGGDTIAKASTKQTAQNTQDRNTRHVRSAVLSPVLNLKAFFEEPASWLNREPQHQVAGHTHAVPAHRDTKTKHHRYHVPNEATDQHNHFRHQCDSDHCIDHNDSHAHHSHPPMYSSVHHAAAPLRQRHGIKQAHHAYFPMNTLGLRIPAGTLPTKESKKMHHVSAPSRNYGAQHIETPDYVHENDCSQEQDQPDGLWTLAIDKNHKHIHRTRAHRAPIGTPEMHLDATFINGIQQQHGSRRRSRQIPGHAHAVPAHRDNGLKHHRFHVPNPPTDHHNHYRHQCDSDHCMDHDKSHAHHGQPSVEHRSRQAAVPVRHRLEVRRAHHAYVPLTPAGLMIPNEAAPTKESKKKRHVSAPSRNYGAQHIETPDYVHENDCSQEQDQPDGLWTLAIDKNHRQTHRLRAHRVSIGTPEMHLDALFDEHEQGRNSRNKSHQIPGHAHAVPAHGDSKLKHHSNHTPNAPADHHNHWRRQCDTEECMDHNESHAHHSMPPDLSHTRQATAPVRQQQGIAHSHPAFIPLVRTFRSKTSKKHRRSRHHITKIPSPIYSSSQHDLYLGNEYRSNEDQYVPDQERDWTLVTHSKSHLKGPAPAHYYHSHTRGVLDTPEMNLGTLFDSDTGYAHRESADRSDQRRIKSFHSPETWAPSAYDHSHLHSAEHHPPSIHSFSVLGGHHAHAVPAHQGDKLKHLYHEANDPTDHHNHHRHQCDDDDCSDHDDSHIHSRGGHSKGHQQNHSGFVHYSTPHNRTVGSYDAKFATRSPRHAEQMHHKRIAAPNSPELNLGALFREGTSRGHFAATAPAFISEQHAHRIGHHHETRLSRSTKATHASPHGQSYAEVVASIPHRTSEHAHSAIHTPQHGTHRKRADSFHGYVFEIPKSLQKITKQHSHPNRPPRRRSIILSGFREVDPVSRYHPAGMYLAPTSVQHGLASAYLRRPSLTRHPRHYHTASQQQQPYPPIHHTTSAGGEYATHVGIGSVKNRFSGPVETMHDLFDGLDTHPAHYQPVKGYVSHHTPMYHTGVPHEVAQSASVQHIPPITGAVPQKTKKTWYGADVPVKEGPRPGPLSLGFGFKEIHKAAIEGRPLHARHASGPSTPVSSTVSTVNQHQASKSSMPIQTYSAAVAHPHGPANLTRRPSIKRQRKDARREMKSTLDRNPHQTLTRRLSVLDTVRTALSGVRMDLIEDMNLNELFAEPTGWSASDEGSAPSSTPEAVVMAGLGSIRHLLDAALSVPAMVAHALHVDGQQETEHSTTIHHGQRHHHSHGHSKAVTLKTSRRGSMDLSLYPEEEPNYPRNDHPQAPSIQENPAHPNNVADYVIEMPYHPPRPGTPIVSRESGNMRLGQGHHLAHHQHYHVQNQSTAPTRLHTHADHATTSHAPVSRSQLDHHRAQRGYHNLSASFFQAASPVISNDRYPEENAGYPRTDAYSLHRNPAHPDSVMDIVELPLTLTSMSSFSKPDRHGLYPEENAGYPRTDAFSLHRNPSHPNLQDIVELPFLSSSSASSSAKLSTLKRAQKTHSYNRSKAAGLHCPKSPLHLYSEEQASYPRDAAHDVASAEYNPRADDAEHQSRVYAPNPYTHRKPVHEIQLDDEDQHAHHDAHPTLTEFASAAVTSGLDGFKAMLQNIHLPDMVVGTLLPEAHEYLQAVQHHAQDHQHEYQDHRPVLRYKEHDGEHGHLEQGHEHGEGSMNQHTSRSAAGHGGFVPSEHHRRHVEHSSTSSYPPIHTSFSSSRSAAAASLAAKHSSAISVLPPESLSRGARLARPPTGFGRGADEDLGEGETIVWTKTVKTTKDFYEVEDDNVDIDEFSFQNQQQGGAQQHVNFQGQYQQQRPRSQRPAQ
ncbi:hypothetical protein BGZ81_007619 [Podila clonocystis]|nr:hypothetical protein BGZ81_007619 [Podila clonocystis]